MGRIGAEEISRLWIEHGSRLVLYARQWCQTPEDVVQQAFVSLVRQMESPENPVNWLYRVVRNRAMDASRAAGRKARREAAVAYDGEPWFETTAGDRLDAAAATEALKGLPLAEREAVVARLWGELSFEEIGELTGTSASTAFRLYRRGLVALRERLGISGDETVGGDSSRRLDRAEDVRRQETPPT